MVKCKNCGAEYAENLSKCPYCGTMHKKGAYRSFRQKISDIIDSVLGLKGEVNRSVSRAILFSVIRALAVVAACLLIAFLMARLAKINYYNDREYDQERLETLVWEEENFAKLDKAYAAGDLEKVAEIISTNTRGACDWQHYGAYQLLKAYNSLSGKTQVNEYYLSECLYFLFYPDYYGELHDPADLETYESNRERLAEKLSEQGYSRTELQDIYDSCRDTYGYVRTADLRKYMKGEDNG